MNPAQVPPADVLRELSFSPSLPSLIQSAFLKTLALDRIQQVYREVSRRAVTGTNIFDVILEVMNITCSYQPEALEQIPESGPLVVTANHPFGGVEGIGLAATLLKRRPDVKVMANFLLRGIPELHPYFIFVDPFDQPESSRTNLTPLRASLEWVRQGGALIMFPAGEVSHFTFNRGLITDPEWNTAAARIAQRSKASVLPIFIEGQNSSMFHVLGLLHPRLRTALLAREFVKKTNSFLTFTIGRPVSPKRVATFPNPVELTEYLRSRTYVLGCEAAEKTAPATWDLTRFRKRSQKPVLDAQPPQVLQAEIEQLPATTLLAEQGEFMAFAAPARRIPTVLQEIGRLREITFRATGEGTGKATDLDWYDQYYLHLFIWNQAERQVVGAYRVGKTDELLAQHGKNGLYTNSLFRFKHPFFDRMNPALELGRSFVRGEYQKTFAPLLLLWKGIGSLVAREPKYKTLFGPVSISRDYSAHSQQLLVSFLRMNRLDMELAPLVQSKTPFRTPGGTHFDLVRACRSVTSLEDLSALITELESDRKGIPVLLKQYLKLGGKILAFNVDTHFNDALDALIYVDLTHTERPVLERYMGREGAQTFLAAHEAELTRTPPE
ncbi:MAG: lysophospholipid acyltransferase family protein [Blastocatellia bacterium]|nr:lysophospholipid acyltransferase family protein [Blastocatellia bacterium]